MIKSLIIRILDRFAGGERGTASFLIPAYTGLGNFIMMTPMIKKLRELFPQSRITIVAGNKFGTESVLKDTGVVVEVLHLNEEAGWVEKLIFFFRLRRQKIDVAFVPFDASPSFYRFGVLLAGIPRTIGHLTDLVGSPMGWTRDALTEVVPMSTHRHESDLHFDLLERLYPGLTRSYATTTETADKDSVLDAFGLRGKRYVVVQVSAANGMKSPKVWPARNFHDLNTELAKDGFIVVLAGDTMERPVIDRFAAESPVPVLNLAGKTSLPEVASLIQGAVALVCHDSGLMHVGNAVGTPLVALYGPTDYEYTKPMGDASVVIRKPLPCAPCMAGFAKTEEKAFRDCPISFECMRNITVTEVYQAVLERARLRKDVEPQTFESPAQTSGQPSRFADK